MLGDLVSSQDLSQSINPILVLLFQYLVWFSWALSSPTGRGEGPLADFFPNENDANMAARVELEINQEIQDSDVGNAWAKLEHSMLSKELEQE